MPDARPSAVSRLLRRLTMQELIERGTDRDREDDRALSAGEIERKLSERDEALFWAWHYPGQW